MMQLQQLCAVTSCRTAACVAVCSFRCQPAVRPSLSLITVQAACQGVTLCVVGRVVQACGASDYGPLDYQTSETITHAYPTKPCNDHARAHVNVRGMQKEPMIASLAPHKASGSFVRPGRPWPRLPNGGWTSQQPQPTRRFIRMYTCTHYTPVS